MCIGNVLRDIAKDENGPELLARDPLFVRGKADIGMFSPCLPPSLALSSPPSLFYVLGGGEG